MSQEVIAPTKKANVVAELGALHGLTADEFAQTLVKTIFPNRQASREEMWALCIVAKEYGLNPLTRQVYAFPGKQGIVPIVSADGWYAIMNRQPNFDGIDHEFVDDEDGNVVACRATIYFKDRSRPLSCIEYVDENKRNTDPWRNQPRRMIRHRASIQAIRMAFGISAMDPEDAERIPEYHVADAAPGDRADAKVEEDVVERARARARASVVAKAQEATGEDPVKQAQEQAEDVAAEPEAAPEPEVSTVQEEAPEKPKAAKKKATRRSRASKAQIAEFQKYLDDDGVDDALVSPELPPDGEYFDEAFSKMWKDDAEALLKRLRAGEFRAQKAPVAVEAEGTPVEGPAEGGGEDDWNI